MSSTPTLLAAYVETVPGLEEVAWLEVRRRFSGAQFTQFLFARDERGIAAFDVPAAPTDLFDLRTVESIFLTVAFLPKTTRGFRDLHRLKDQMQSSGDVGRAVNAYSRYRRRQVYSYRLIVRTYGKQEYDRRAVRRAVIQSLDQLYPDWERVQDEPDVELWANVLGSSILLGLRLPPPRDRARPQPEPGAMPTSVASALVLLTDPQDSDHFLDPFFDGGAVVSARSAHPARLLLGGASDPRRLETQAFQVGSSLPLLTNWDAAHLPLPAAALDRVATRFPYHPASTVLDYYVPWLRELQRVLQPGAQVVVLTRAFESFKDAIRQAPALEIRGGYSVTIAGEWGRIYLLQRT